jgi:hypothetical protein
MLSGPIDSYETRYVLTVDVKRAFILEGKSDLKSRIDCQDGRRDG